MFKFSAYYSPEENEKRRIDHYVNMAVCLGIKNPENLVKRLINKKTNNLSMVLKRHAKVKPIKKRTIKKKVILKNNGIVECTVKKTPMCLRKFVSNGGTVCLKCK